MNVPKALSFISIAVAIFLISAVSAFAVTIDGASVNGTPLSETSEPTLFYDGVTPVVPTIVLSATAPEDTFLTVRASYADGSYAWTDTWRRVILDGTNPVAVQVPDVMALVQGEILLNISVGQNVAGRVPPDIVEDNTEFRFFLFPESVRGEMQCRSSANTAAPCTIAINEATATYNGTQSANLDVLLARILTASMVSDEGRSQYLLYIDPYLFTECVAGSDCASTSTPLNGQDAITTSCDWIPEANGGNGAHSCATNAETIAFDFARPSLGSSIQVIFRSSGVSGNAPPYLRQEFPRIQINEDAPLANVLDLYTYFRDDNTNEEDLLYFVEGNFTNPELLTCGTTANRYVSCQPVPNRYGWYIVEVTATDNGGASTTRPLFVDITNANDDIPYLFPGIPTQLTIEEDSPIVSALDTWAADDDGNVTFSVIANGGNINTTVLPSYANGFNTGHYMWYVGTAGFIYDYVLSSIPFPDWYGNTSVQLQVLDSTGNTINTSVIPITVTPLNDAPRINASAPTSVTVTEEGAPNQTIDLSQAFYDVENDVTQWRLSANTNPFIAIVSINQSGTVTITPSNTSQATTAGTLSFEASDDGFVDSISQNHTISLNFVNINDIPYVTQQLPDAEMNEDETDITIVNNLRNYFDDEETGGALTFNATSSQPDISFFFGGNGARLRVSSANNFTGNATITVTAFDDILQNVSQNFTLEVLPANDPPTVALQINNTNIAEDSSANVLVADLTPYFNDIDSPPLNFSASSNESLVGVDASTGALVASATGNFTGIATITVFAMDDQGASTNQSFALTVNPVNDPPLFSGTIADTIIPQDTSDSGIYLPNYVSDIDNTTLTYSSTTPANISVSIAPDGRVTLTPDAGFTGTRAIVFSASDGQYSADSNTVTLSIAQFSQLVNTQINGTLYPDGNYSNISGVLGSSLTNAVVLVDWSFISSAITDSTLNNTYLTSSTVLNSTVINSDLTSCTITNSFVKNYFGSNCVVSDSTVDPPSGGNNLTGSTITNGSTVMRSNVTYSTVSNTAVNDSNVNGSTLSSSTITNATLDNVTATNNTALTLVNLVGGTIDASTLTNVNATNASVTGTTITNVALTSAVITNGVLTSGQLTFNGSTYDADTSGAANTTALANYAPVASFSASATSANTGVSVTFTSTAADPNIPGALNDTLSEFWDFGDSTNATGNATSHSYSTAGTYTITLTVTDSFGESSTASQQVTITTPSDGGGSGSGGGGGGSPFVAPRASVSSISFLGGPARATARQGDQFLFTFNGEQHVITVEKIGSNYAEVSIASTKTTKVVGIDGRELYNVDGDKTYDVAVKLFSIQTVGGAITAEFEFSQVSEPVPMGFGAVVPITSVVPAVPAPAEEPAAPDVPAPEDNTTVVPPVTGAVVGPAAGMPSTGFLIAAAIVLIGLGVYVVAKKVYEE